APCGSGRSRRGSFYGLILAVGLDGKLGRTQLERIRRRFVSQYRLPPVSTGFGEYEGTVESRNTNAHNVLRHGVYDRFTKHRWRGWEKNRMPKWRGGRPSTGKNAEVMSPIT